MQMIYEAILNWQGYVQDPISQLRPSCTQCSGCSEFKSKYTWKEQETAQISSSFNGDITTTWSSFWDSYEAIIHKDLADVDKFNYLNSLMEGSFREALWTRTDSSQQSWRYSYSSKTDILLNTDPVTLSQNIKGLYNLYDLVESQVDGVTSESYSSLLFSVLFNKLPLKVWLIVTREVSEKVWGFNVLMKVMIEARERIATNPGQTQQQRTSNWSPSTAAALISRAAPSNPDVTVLLSNRVHVNNY